MQTIYCSVIFRITTQAVLCLSLYAAGLRGNPAEAIEPNGIAPGQRIVFLGDSITDAGRYIAWLDAHYFVSGKEDAYQPPQLINLGLPSETCSGLSEPAHPFSRPDVHERLARVLKLSDPEVVFACYGINDGIYHPFDPTRFEKYQQGILQIVTKCKAAGVKVVLLTPPPFDPQPLRKRGKLAKRDADSFSWKTPYEDYNQVMRKYAEWMLTLGDEADAVIDLFHPIEHYVAERRSEDPDFALSEDGVHLNAKGHQLIADAIVRKSGTELIYVEPDLLQLFQQRQRITHTAWLSKVGHKRPGVKPGLPLLEAATARGRLTKQIEQLQGSSSTGE